MSDDVAGARGTVYLVRHAKAGERRGRDGDDVERPLSGRGRRQAEALAERLAGCGATTLHSSPYLRCVQTLEPLGARLGTAVHREPRLCEGEPFEPVLGLIATVDDGAVLCTHGDIIPDVIAALQRRGMELRSAADWRKGATWVLRRTSHGVATGRVWPPTG